MLNVFLVGIGGMVGSMLRYGVSMLPMECGDGFPIKTLLTNIVGCFLIGIIVMLSGKYSKLSPEMTLMLKTGVWRLYYIFYICIRVRDVDSKR